MRRSLLTVLQFAVKEPADACPAAKPGMTRSRSGATGALLLAFALFQGGSIGPAIAQPVPPLAANDVSWLFPAPKEEADLANLISVGDLKGQGALIWPKAAFDRFVEIIGSEASQVAGTPHKIVLPEAVKDMAVWHVAGVRLDTGAPGHAADIKKQFGQIPQIRLILQPVTRRTNGSLEVHDITAHLTYSFVTGAEDAAEPGCGRRPVPDTTALKAIVDDLAALRTALANGKLGNAGAPDDAKVDTANSPLGVHPGLANPVTAKAVRDEMKALLERHLAGRPPGAMAIMGLPGGKREPWIFLAMAFVPPSNLPPNGGFLAIRSPTLEGKAQALSFVPSSKGVFPIPSNNNLSDVMTCRDANVFAPLDPAGRRGASTAGLFTGPTAKPEVREILDLIANPAKSHFFNTDCVSCHTETRRGIALLEINDVPGIDPAVLPKSNYNVRNFGWFFQAPTVTRRTANETQEVVKFINENLLAQ